jgi:cell division protein FtsZ
VILRHRPGMQPGQRHQATRPHHQLTQKELSLSESNNLQSGTVIKVIGVGGAGGNAVNHMAASGLMNIEFVCANTDAQALTSTGNATRIQLGETGLGAGSDPVVGREAAIRERAAIGEALKGAHMVFITAGMGGGTGTGAAPVVAEVAKEMGILTVGVVSKPFEFEGARRMRVADEGIQNLSKSVDSLVIVLNSRLEEVLGDDITQKEAFAAADDVLSKAVSGIAEIISVPGMVNVDFEDVRTVMRQMGTAMMGTAVHSGEDRAVKAAEEAISCPLLDGSNLHAARGLLVNIAASEQTLKLRETKQVMNVICAQMSDDAIIKFGAVFDETLGDAMRVTVVATGLTRPFEAAAGGRMQGHASGSLVRGSGMKDQGMHQNQNQNQNQHRGNFAGASQQYSGQGSRVLSAPRPPVSGGGDRESNRPVVPATANIEH